MSGRGQHTLESIETKIQMLRLCILLLVLTFCCSFVLHYTPKTSHHGSSLHVLHEPLHASFWSKTRSDDEIIDYCAHILFEGDTKKTKSKVEIISNELPLILIHDFMSEEDCGDIKDEGIRIGLKRSTTGESQDTSSTRTSSTTWIRDKDLKPIKTLRKRVADLVGLGTDFQENAQVVKYEPGQKFDLHTDHQESFNDLDCRGRLATVLLYLNSSKNDGNDNKVDLSNPTFDGGETYFPEYGMNVVPKRGTACFWFNTIERPGVLNYDPLAPLTLDLRSRHAGNPVLYGTKWVCNLWVHPISLL